MTNDHDRWQGKIEAEVDSLREQVKAQTEYRAELTKRYDQRLDDLIARVNGLSDALSQLTGRWLMLGVVGSLLIAGGISYLVNHVG